MTLLFRIPGLAPRMRNENFPMAMAPMMKQNIPMKAPMKAEEKLIAPQQPQVPQLQPQKQEQKQAAVAQLKEQPQQELRRAMVQEKKKEMAPRRKEAVDAQMNKRRVAARPRLAPVPLEDLPSQELVREYAHELRPNRKLGYDREHIKLH